MAPETFGGAHPLSPHAGRGPRLPLVGERGEAAAEGEGAVPDAPCPETPPQRRFGSACASALHDEVQGGLSQPGGERGGAADPATPGRGPRPTSPEKGHAVRATVRCIAGTCNAGHAVGDVMAVSARDTAGMCGYLYHAAHPAILMLQFGGDVPWGTPGTVELPCPDPVNRLTLELRRVPAEPPATPGTDGPVRFGRVVARTGPGSG